MTWFNYLISCTIGDVNTYLELKYVPLLGYFLQLKNYNTEISVFIEEKNQLKL